MNTKQQKSTTAKIKSATKASCKTMVAKKENKTNEALAKFWALSAEAQQVRDVIAASTGNFLTVNSVLISMYEEETGCKQFKTFLQWKAEGFSVKKNEKCFRVWGAPLKAKSRDELPINEAQEENNISESNYKFWPTCCLFNENQVHKNGDNSDHASDDLEVKKEIILDEKTDVINEVIETIAEVNHEADALENNAFVRADYIDHQDSRRERLADRAIKASSESQYQYKKSRDLVSGIEFGQPILIGHHSERRHRKTLDKSWAAMGKCVALSDKADHLANKAASVGSAGIASDDPEAIVKLKEKLAGLVDAHEKMKAANKLILKNDFQGLINLGFSESRAHEIFTPNHMNARGFASYALQNNSAEIRRIKKRIEELQKLHSAKPYEFVNDDFRIYVADGRVRVSFTHGKPSQEVCKIVGSQYSFNYSRTCVEWVRKATANAMAQAPRLAARLCALEAIY